MKKNLLMLVLVFLFVYGGVSVANAKNSLPSENSVAMSKSPSPAKTIYNKIKALKEKCVAKREPCAAQLDWLQQMNQLYDLDCKAGGYQGGCSPGGEADLIRAAVVYELCLWLNGYASNIDKTKDRNKNLDSNV